MSDTLAARLKEARARTEPPVLQKDIAKRFSVTPGAVCLWEKGSTEPSSEVLAELAKLYGVSMNWLVGLPEHAAPNQVVVKAPPLHTVPVLSPRSLAQWKLDFPLEMLQTSVSYPVGSAAAMLVASDALTSTCPTGAYVVVSKSHAPTSGSIVVASVGRSAEPILRRYLHEGDQSLLMADDARWPTVTLGAGSKILGTVVEVTTRRRLI